MLIRHAEEACGDREPNLDEKGLQDPQGLSLRGWQRAGALVRYFAPLGGHPEGAEIARPSAIFAMASTADQPSRRPRLSVTPLAQALELPVQEATDEEELIPLLVRVRGPVLVCWRHASLPALARRIAPQTAVPSSWPEDCYDLVWVIEQAPDLVRFRRVPQRLLAGDARSASG